MSDQPCRECARLASELVEATREADATFECQSDERQKRKWAETELDRARSELVDALRGTWVPCSACKHGRVLSERMVFDDECPDCQGEGRVNAVAEVARLKAENAHDRAEFDKACKVYGDHMRAEIASLHERISLETVREIHDALAGLTGEEFMESLKISIGATEDYAVDKRMQFRRSPEDYILSRSPSAQGEALLTTALKKYRGKQ